jgi:hypothetical protein
MLDSMAEVTQILEAIDHGKPQAAAALLPLVYEELRRLAAHRLDHEPQDRDQEPCHAEHLVPS